MPIGKVKDYRQYVAGTQHEDGVLETCPACGKSGLPGKEGFLHRVVMHIDENNRLNFDQEWCPDPPKAP